MHLPKKNINMLRCLYLFLFILITNCGVCFAVKLVKPVAAKRVTVKPAAKPAVLKADSSAIRVRALSKADLKWYSKQAAFNYDEHTDPPSLWERFWRWFWHWFWGLFHVPKFTKAMGFWVIAFVVLKYLLILIGIVALVFLILKIMGIDLFFVFRRKSQVAGLAYTEQVENIHEINFDAEIEKAIASHNYRLAVRLLYLKSLKQLSDASLIAWQPEKTNTAYINELTDVRQRSTFKQLTHQFEYVWYGGFLIDADVFGRINLMFQDFKTAIA
jgi:hypothetical protein